MAAYRLAVLASGEGTNLQALIDKVHRPNKAVIAVVISDREGAGALRRAREARIPAIALIPERGEGRKGYHRRLAVELVKHSPQLIVLAGYMRLIPGDFIRAMPPIINVHPSLLPAFPGMGAPTQALAYGAKVSGCTVHLVDEGMDTGPIISQQVLPVLTTDTPDSLHERIKILEHEALVKGVAAFANGRVKIAGRIITIEEDEDGH